MVCWFSFFKVKNCKKCISRISQSHERARAPGRAGARDGRAGSRVMTQSDRTAERMSEAELYHFDLAGYVIVRNVLSDDELRVANEAIDRQELQSSPSYAGSSVALAGELRADGTGPITRLGNTVPLLEMGASPDNYSQFLL